MNYSRNGNSKSGMRYDSSMTALQSLFTISYLTAELQATPVRIRAAAQRAGVVPALVINGGTEYFAESDVEKIRGALADESAAVERA